MKKYILVLLFLFIFLLSSIFYGRYIVSVKKEISIGKEKGNDNYIFGRIEDVAVDEKGNIYILDSIRERIQKFDRNGKFLFTIGKPKFHFKNIGDYQKNLRMVDEVVRKEGIKPDELFHPKKLFYKKNKLYVLDIDKVCIYSSSHNELLRTIPLNNLIGRWIFVNNNDEIVIGGIKLDSDKIFHVFDENGNLKYSFGDYFDIPPDIRSSLPKEFNSKVIATPSWCYYCVKTNKYYLLNPFKYEIKIYQGKKLNKVITPPIKGYRTTPPQGIVHYINGKFAGYSTGFIAPPTIIKRGDYLFVFHPDIELGFCSVDVFKNNVLQETLKADINGFPIVMDKEGYIYCIREENGSYSLTKYLFILSEN